MRWEQFCSLSGFVLSFWFKPTLAAAGNMRSKLMKKWTPTSYPSHASVFCVFVSGLLLTSSSPAQSSDSVAAAALPVRPELPDPLVMQGGEPVRTREQWQKERRPELKALFQRYMYGTIPPAPVEVRAKVLGQYADFLGGDATLRLVTLETGPAGAPQINLMLVVPNNGPKPAPVFLAMNFCGNQALSPDPRIPLAKEWVPDFCPGCTNNTCTDASRGAQMKDWPLSDIVRRGYALAAFYSGDVDPDRAAVSEGLYAWLAHKDGRQNVAANRGTLAAWAWGFERCVDYLVKDRDIDAKRIAVVGHSRNGKAALLAAAFDERIAIGFPHQAGCGGSAPSRGKIGESVKAINDRFPHWFNAAFKQFNDSTERLPFDQNCLVALCAPRAVLFSAAEEDQWANPAGQFEVLKAAEGVYRLLGAPGLGAAQMPPLRQLVGSRLGFYIREGKHSMTAGDWRVFMDFADRQWRPEAKE